MVALRVLIAEDNDDLSAVLVTILADSPGIDCVGSTASLDELADRARQAQASIVVLDMELQGQSSLRRLPQLRAELPGVAFVVFTGHDNPELMRAAQSAGAAAYVVKSSGPEALIAAIRKSAPASAGNTRPR